MKKQVDKAHYDFGKYVHKQRWASMWHQLDEVINLYPERVLEVGPGPGLFKAVASAMGVHVETLDLDPELKPDHVASVFEMPFEDASFDVVCAFQMLEHMPFDQSREAFREMARVAGKAIVISLPDAATRWPVSIHVPTLGPVRFMIPRPRLVAPRHEFDGEHHWEISKAGYSLKRVASHLLDGLPLRLTKTFRVHEHPYHRFFVFEKANTRGPN
ncbi:class I SAM-dependent methyltransferase [Thioalkalivibrio versutus]|uniref:class I SAM-dependent methyltransferase n=1 Tax=Thioalkalivibrio versutus TaxID=106634 RepID=UPI000364353E|nr:class I SAM-dependent methyltransferase [Thioalkalivibrio versutus]OOC48227.1 SAM-dependent methyltransferase [Thioalkalivibrio versutus]